MCAGGIALTHSNPIFGRIEECSRRSTLYLAKRRSLRTLP